MGMYLYGVTTYTSTMAALESWLVVDVRRLAVFVLFGVGLILLISRNISRSRTRLIWEEESDAQRYRLGLD